MFLKNCWYVAAFAHELGDKPLARTFMNEPVVMFRANGGKPVALLDRCCHRGLPLKHGKVVPEGIECGYHGLRFDTEGKCVRIPGQDNIPASARVQNFPLVEQDGLVWIWLGDPANADPAEIETIPWHNDPAWGHKGKLNTVGGPALMIWDNLLDLTHVGYVHTSTIGGSPDTHSTAEQKTERTDNGIKSMRWLRNSLPPPTYIAAAGFKGRVDRWAESKWRPGIMTLYTGAKDVGTGAYDGNLEGGFKLKSIHAICPETENSAHYFWTIAHELRPDMPELTERVYREIDAAFAEDKIIIESQAERVRQKPLPPLMDIKSDAPVVQMHRVFERRMQEEQNEHAPHRAEAATS